MKNEILQVPFQFSLTCSCCNNNLLKMKCWHFTKTESILPDWLDKTFAYWIFAGSCCHLISPLVYITNHLVSWIFAIFLKRKRYTVVWSIQRNTDERSSFLRPDSESILSSWVLIVFIPYVSGGGGFFLVSLWGRFSESFSAGAICFKKEVKSNFTP